LKEERKRTPRKKAYNRSVILILTKSKNQIPKDTFNFNLIVHGYI